MSNNSQQAVGSGAAGLGGQALHPDSARAMLGEQDSLLQQVHESVNLLEQRLAILDPNDGGTKANVRGDTASRSQLSELANGVDRHNDSLRALLTRLDQLNTVILNNL